MSIIRSFEKSAGAPGQEKFPEAINGSIGGNGYASLWVKRERVITNLLRGFTRWDLVFGYGESFPTQMEYRQAT